MAWTAADIPDLTGRVAIVTGANSGLGEVTTLELARHGAHVVMACRSADKAEAARAEIVSQVPGASLEIGSLDLSDLDSVQRFADSLDHDSVHLLVNNAGVMALPQRATKQGFEMQIGTNHFGHFALTGRVFDRLVAADQARIVNVSSLAHWFGRMRWNDVHFESGFYQRWLAYGQSKLANLLFTFEAARRLQEQHPHVISAAAHPGYSDTHLQTQGADMDGSALKRMGMRFLNTFFSQSADMGALPSLYAATHPDVQSGDYIGPRGVEWMGYPTRAFRSARSRNPEDGRRLWELSMEVTGVRFLEG